MAQAKRKKGKGKEQGSDLPVPRFNALIKPDVEHKRTAMDNLEDQSRIQILPIPEQVVVVKESNYGRRNFWLQLALVACSIAMLYTVYKLSSAQNEITNNTLRFQIQKTFSDSIAQGLKDSLTFMKTERSLALTRQSNERADKMSKFDLRPYIVVDTNLIDFSILVNQPIKVKISIRNVGKTPAYNCFHVNSCGVIDTQNVDHSESAAIGHFFKQAGRHNKGGNSIGSSSPHAKSGTYGVLTPEKAAAVNNGKMKLVLCGLICYSDIFKERHFTWYCYELDVKKSEFIMIAEHTGAD